MKKSIILSMVLATLASQAWASGYIPMGVTAPAQVSAVNAQSVTVEVQEPKAIHTTWDKVAASLKGCVAEGGQDSDLAAGRTYLRFDTLKCEGRAPIHIQAIAVSPADNKLGLVGQVGKATPLTLEFLASAEMKKAGS